MLSAKRKTMIIKHLTIVDQSNQLRALVSFGKQKRVDQFNGFICKLPSNINIENLLKENKTKSSKKKKTLFDLAFSDLTNLSKNLTLENLDKLIKKNKVNSSDILGRIEGIWPESFKIDENEFWNPNQKGLQFHLCKDVLPSDYRFREDILWMKNKNIPNAQKWKLKLELLIRQERKARELLNKKRN